jgi:hypothetical protein
MPEIVYIVETEKVLAEMSQKTAYDALKFIAAVQGVVNKARPLIFLNNDQETDMFWFDYLKEKMFCGYGIEHISSIEVFFEVFRHDIINLGVTLWDETVPATSNVATTVCGVDGNIPLRFSQEKGSLYEIMNEKGLVNVKLDLVGKFNGAGTIFSTNLETTKSAKADAYLYALENYFDRTNDHILGYALDATTWAADYGDDYPDRNNAFVPNTDYYVYRSVFVFDLSPWGDEKPCDDRNQPLGTDLKVFKEILLRQYKKNKGQKITTVVGFTPWQLKYTSYLGKSKHDPVPTEWEHAELLSAYNCIMDADAASYCGLANASIYASFRMDDRYFNSKPEVTHKYDKTKTYLLFYMGDYDSAAWLTKFVPRLYSDSSRGEYPLTWCVNPNLSDRVPVVFDYLYKNRTKNDYFASGDSGAGYINPTLLFEPRVHSELPDGADVWLKHNRLYFDKFDISFVGFLLDGRHRINHQVIDLYSRFARTGVAHNSYGEDTFFYNDVPFIPHTSDIGGESTSAREGADELIRQTKNAKGRFHVFRTILWLPSRLSECMRIIKEENPEANYELVDFVTFFELLRESKSIEERKEGKK